MLPAIEIALPSSFSVNMHLVLWTSNEVEVYFLGMSALSDVSLSVIEIFGMLPALPVFSIRTEPRSTFWSVFSIQFLYKNLRYL